MPTPRSFHFETIVSSPFEQNAYVVWKDGRDEAIVVDPGFDIASLLAIVSRHGLRLAAIVNTHGHADHIAGNAPMKKAHPDTPLVIGRGDAHLLIDTEANLSAGFGMPIQSPPADRLLDEGERLELAGFSFLVREIPGHSPGSIVLIADAETPTLVLAGDVLFAGSVGRTDFPGGSSGTLFEGIRSKLFVLPDDALILSGHGPTTTVGRERRTNPFVGQGAG